MMLVDVNVLVYALRADTADHDRYHEWLEEALISPSGFSYHDWILGAVLRVATHPKIYKTPTPTGIVWRFLDSIRNHPGVQRLENGSRHWSLFQKLCRDHDCRGNDITDAWYAALALENDVEWITTDRGFARFRGLRWRHPLGHA